MLTYVRRTRDLPFVSRYAVDTGVDTRQCDSGLSGNVTGDFVNTYSYGMFYRFNGPLCVCFLFVFMSNVQVNIFQSYRDGATASWVFTSTMGSKCAMFKDMKMVSPVGVEPST